MPPSLPPRLVRHPSEGDPSLQAWDAADTLLLDWLAGRATTGPAFPTTPPPIDRARTAVVGDRFGAVTLGLLAADGPDDSDGSDDAGGPDDADGPRGSSDGPSGFSVGRRDLSDGLRDSSDERRDLSDSVLRVFSDSVLSGEALRINAERLAIPPTRWTFAPLSRIDAAPPASIDLVLYKVPRSLGALENLLHQIRPALAPGACLLGAGMTKHVHSSTLELLASIIGTTRTSHARRRARLIHSGLDDTLTPPPNPWPVWWEVDGIRTCNHAGVFSAKGLDQGTRVLMDRLPTLMAGLPQDAQAIVDLGCGNGVLGTWLARERPGAEVEFRDVSFAALRSAEATWRASGVTAVARFTPADGMTGRDDQSVDLIVCNPPFHAQGARGERTSRAMFAGAYRTLRPGGQLWVVGNRHLAYLPRLRRRFGEAERIGDHARFNVVRAVRAAD